VEEDSDTDFILREWLQSETSFGFMSTQCYSPEDNTLYKIYRESIKLLIKNKLFFNLYYNKMESNTQFKFSLLVLIILIMQVYLYFRYATDSFENVSGTKYSVKCGGN
jgi:hypothetical protein